MSDLRSYMKNLNQCKLLNLIFKDHFESKGYKKVNDKKYDLKNNITIELQSDNSEFSLLLKDNSSDVITSFLFDSDILLKPSLILKSQRLSDTYYFDELLENKTIYDLLNLLELTKETYLID